MIKMLMYYFYMFLSNVFIFYLYKSIFEITCLWNLVCGVVE